MNIYVLVNLAGLLTLGALLLALSRGTAVLLVLLPASQMLGFLDPMAIAVKGAFDVHLLILITTLGLIALSLHRLRDLSRATFLLPYLILFLFWAYGVLLPVATNTSSLFFSLKASKEFLTAFTYFGVFLFLRTERDIEWGWRFLLWLGLYYSGLEILGQVLGETLLKHMAFDYRREGHWLWKIYLSFWPVILITFLHSFFELSQLTRRTHINLILGSCGLLLTFFRSYLLGSLGAIPLCLVLARQHISKIATKAIVLGSLIAITILSITVLISGDFDLAGGMFERFISSGITEMQTQKGGALEGREVFARERREILAESPYGGYGFIDKDSKAGIQFQKQIMGDMLGFIDKGDLDVALKFGLIGQILLYGTFTYISWGLIRIARQSNPSPLSVRCLTLATTVIVFLVVQPVHAPLTYSFGLLPFGIALGLIDRERLLVMSRLS